MEKIRIGNLIRPIREHKGLSQGWVAQQLGIEQGTYSKVENNTQKVELQALIKYAQALEVDLDTLVNANSNQVFNNCHQSGNINQINNHHSEKEILLMEKLIETFDDLTTTKNRLDSLINRIAELEKM